tara:strand:- start:58 stop:501 length:444 start_codon:yes stop_codon:yes gene_type:complete
MYTLILIVHVLAASIWTGGHLFLALGLLPKVLKDKDYSALLNFERNYEKVGMPALIVQVLTGVYLSYNLLPNFSEWLSFQNHISFHISLKLILLALTILLAVIANTVIIPNIKKGNNLTIMAVFAYLVTLLSIFFVIVGLSFRLFIF